MHVLFGMTNDIFSVCFLKLYETGILNETDEYFLCREAFAPTHP